MSKEISISEIVIELKKSIDRVQLFIHSSLHRELHNELIYKFGTPIKVQIVRDNVTVTTYRFSTPHIKSRIIYKRISHLKNSPPILLLNIEFPELTICRDIYELVVAEVDYLYRIENSEIWDLPLTDIAYINRIEFAYDFLLKSEKYERILLDMLQFGSTMRYSREDSCSSFKTTFYRGEIGYVHNDLHGVRIYPKEKGVRIEYQANRKKLEKFKLEFLTNLKKLSPSDVWIEPSEK